MKKSFILIILITLFTSLYSQEAKQDYSLAKVGNKIHGVYVFINSTPAHDYKSVATLKGKIDLYNFEETAYNTIRRLKTVSADFNGIIFNKGNIEMIKIGNEKMRMGGFSVGDKVTFIRRVNGKKQVVQGEIIKLESQMDEAAVKFYNNDGKSKMRNIFYGDLTLVK